MSPDPMMMERGGDLYGGWSPLLPLVSQRIRGNRYPGSDTHHLYPLGLGKDIIIISNNP